MIDLIATELPRVMACNGSRLMPAVKMPETAGSTRQEGIAAHFMALSVFNGTVSDPSELVDRAAPNGVYMTAEMADHVGEYLKVFREHAKICVVAQMEVETEISTPDFSVKGRADFISYNSMLGTLNILDFKYGWSAVEPDDNWTLIFHAIAWCIKNGVKPNNIVLSIFQPRPYHRLGSLREVPMSFDELELYYARLLDTLSNLSDALQTGPQCTKCHALVPCSAARDAQMNAIEASGIAFVDDIPNDVLSFELENIERAQKMLEERGKALVELARHRIMNGQPIENYAIETQLGNTTWNAGLTPEILGAMTGKDLSKPGMITPAAAKRLSVPDSLIDALTYRPVRGHKLVRENTSKRAARLLGK